MSPQDKISSLRRLLNGAALVQGRDSDDAQFKIWKNLVERTLAQIYGQASLEVKQFQALRFFCRPATSVLGTFVQEHRECFDRDFQILTSSIRHYIEEILQAVSHGSEVDTSVPTDHHHTRVFISHASIDRPFVEELIELLSMAGLKHEQIFCTSFPEYGIELGENFVNALKKELIGTKTLVLFLLSKAFYSSPICLCEMGATWALSKEHIPILVPPFGFPDVKGVFPLTQGFKLNEPPELTQFKTRIESAFGLRDSCGFSWERRRNSVIDRINSKIARNCDSISVVFDPASNPDAIKLIQLRCIPEEPVRGTRITLIYEFESKVGGVCVWFGADLERDGTWICDANEDTEQILTKGRQSYRRYLSIPAYSEPGTYRLNAQIWFGERSKPKLSQALVRHWPDRIVTLA